MIQAIRLFRSGRSGPYRQELVPVDVRGGFSGQSVVGAAPLPEGTIVFRAASGRFQRADLVSLGGLFYSVTGIEPLPPFHVRQEITATAAAGGEPDNVIPFGGATPTATATATHTPTSTPTFTPTFTPTHTAGPTPTHTPTFTPTNTFPVMPTDVVKAYWSTTPDLPDLAFIGNAPSVPFDADGVTINPGGFGDTRAAYLNVLCPASHEVASVRQEGSAFAGPPIMLAAAIVTLPSGEHARHYLTTTPIRVRAGNWLVAFT